MINSYILRFFLNKDNVCNYQFTSTEPPVIPHKGEIINLDDNDWEPYMVTNVAYCYPSGDINDCMLIDVTAESCDYEYGMDEEEDIV